ncbi:MAG TPA: type IX secretion system membrane protein PorP/SprF, partial [Chitinophagales bacterium]|nr:type IX secretion system membrane protein PorP/SprF [Chitinophagales bacterium]
MKRVVAFWICCLCASVTYAQDIHFSQFFAAPILVNPANTGNFIGSARIGLNYRDQWGSVTIPYRTFS